MIGWNLVSDVTYNMSVRILHSSIYYTAQSTPCLYVQVVVDSIQSALQCQDQYLTMLSRQNFGHILWDRYIFVSLHLVLSDLQFVCRIGSFWEKIEWLIRSVRTSNRCVILATVSRLSNIYVRVSVVNFVMPAGFVTQCLNMLIYFSGKPRSCKILRSE